MSEKGKKSLIIISSVFIFVLVFMVFFTFYRRDAMLSDRTIPKVNTDINNIIPEEDPPSLGDTCRDVTTCNCSGGGKLSSGWCYGSPTSMSTVECVSSGGYMLNNQCYKSRSKASCNTYTTCTSCTSGRYLSGSSCNLCPAGSYCTGGSAGPITCPAGSYCPGGASSPTKCGSNQVSQVSGASNCETCPTGQVANSEHTRCIVETPATNQCWTTENNCSARIEYTNTSCSAAGAYDTQSACQSQLPENQETITCYKQSSDNSCTTESLTLPVNNSTGHAICPNDREYYSSLAACESHIDAKNNQTRCYIYNSTSNKCELIVKEGIFYCKDKGYYTLETDCNNEVDRVKNVSVICPSSVNVGDDFQCTVKGFYSGGVGARVTVSDTSVVFPYYVTGSSASFTALAPGTVQIGIIQSYDSSDGRRFDITGTSTTVTVNGSTESKCCCNLASGHCSMATTCTGSLPIEMTNVSSVEGCVALNYGAGSACFKTSSGEYKWGSYGNNASYTIYSAITDKESCEKKNSSTSTVDCSLRCPSTILKVGETISCTFISSDGSTLSSASSGFGVNGRYVEVSSDKSGTFSVSGSSNTCTSNAVSITVLSDEDGEEDDCKITSVSTNSQKVSLDGDGYSNSYYVVFVNVEGLKCSGKTLTLSASNASSISPSVVSITSSARSGQYSFHVYPNKGCDFKSTPTAKLSNGSSKIGPTVSLTVDWHPIYNVCEVNPKYTSFLVADSVGADEYYSAWDSDKKCYTIKWTRGCGTGSSSGTPSGTTSTPTPTPAPTYACYANAKDLINATKTTWATSGSSAYPYLISGKTQAECNAYACFVNTDGSDYKWANMTPSGYTKVSNILSQSLCKPESAACYIDKNGNYSWGKHKNDSNYTFVTSITSESSCKKIEGSACYCNDSKCVWNTTSPGSDYVKVSDMDTSVKCKKDEYACFLHNNKYIWGNYMNQNGYYYVAGITEQEYCTNIGCYVNNNEYVWGDYSDDSSYTFVGDITERSRCGYTPDVPKTSLNTQAIVYIATAIMSVAGIYFVVRYNNKSKNM